MSEIRTSIMHNVLLALYSTTLSEDARRNVICSYIHGSRTVKHIHDWGYRA